MTRERIRVGVVGLGSIARKAYLPVLSARSGLDVRLCTRDRDSLDTLGEAYRVEQRYRDVGEMIGAGLDAAFVHVATPAHVDVVTPLLEAGVPTYVDKPLANSLDECARLVELARANSCSLMVGFNRRYAPVYHDLAASRPSLVLMQKNRVGLADSARHVVFDDFVHIVDTLRFLTSDAELDDVQADARGGDLELLVVRLRGPGAVAIGSMNRNGGYTQELLETHGPGFRHVVRDMAQVDHYEGGRHLVVRRDDWTPTTVQRGFDAICDRFLEAVRRGETLDAGDALRTHELCEEIVSEIDPPDHGLLRPDG